MMQTAVFYIQFLILKSLAVCINALPVSWAYWFGDRLGDALFFLSAERRELTIRNLRAAFKDKKTEKEIRTIARDCFRQLMILAVEFMRIPQWAEHIEEHLEMSGVEHAWKALEQGKGLILLISHQGNWELMAIGTAAAGLPIHAIARPMKNPFLYRYIKKLRGSRGLKSVDKAGALRETVKLLKKNQIVCFLADQRESQGGIEVTFFGRPALTGTLPAVLALRYGVPVAPLFYRRPSRFQRAMIFGPAISIVQTGNFEEDVRANTQQFIRTVEESIEQEPASWLWMHNRWRS